MYSNGKEEKREKKYRSNTSIKTLWFTHAYQFVSCSHDEPYVHHFNSGENSNNGRFIASLFHVDYLNSSNLVSKMKNKQTQTEKNTTSLIINTSRGRREKCIRRHGIMTFLGDGSDPFSAPNKLFWICSCIQSSEKSIKNPKPTDLLAKMKEGQSKISNEKRTRTKINVNQVETVAKPFELISSMCVILFDARLLYAPRGHPYCLLVMYATYSFIYVEI